MHDSSEHGRDFHYEVDGKTYASDHPRISGGEIMDAADIPREVGLIEILPDGMQRVVPADEILNLAQLEGKFKKCPTFQRG